MKIQPKQDVLQQPLKKQNNKLNNQRVTSNLEYQKLEIL